MSEKSSSVLVMNSDDPNENTPIVTSPREIAAAERERAEIESAMTIAKKFPRNETEAFRKVMTALERPSLAAAARYKFPRGGKDIIGPSVALSRAIAGYWGNIKYGIKIVDSDDETVHIRGFAWDTENNSYIEMEDRFDKLVQRKVKQGGKKVTAWVKPDERDLRELINRRGAIAVRNALLQLIPADVVEAACNQAATTLQKAAKNELAKSREDVVRNIVLVFDKIGVSKKDLEDYLGHDLKQIDEAELTDLRSVHQSIKDGNAKASEFFGSPEPEASPLAEKLQSSKKSETSKTPTKESEGLDQAKGEQQELK